MSSSLSARTSASTKEARSTPAPRPATRSDKTGFALSWATLLQGLMVFTVALLIVIIGGILGLAWWINQKVGQFTTAAGTSLPLLAAQVRQGLETMPVHTDQHVNVLILGVDSLSTRGDVPPLADTLILASLDLKTAKVVLVPLPRDIWNAEYSTKINALLAYGQQRDPQRPTAFPAQVVSEMTGVPVHYTITLTLDKVAELIDQVGGITIDVPVGFVDDQFPRTDVDVTTVSDPKLLYERVEFVAGPQRFDGPTALKYIRSRHSIGSEGDDIARSRRQQQVIGALLAQLTQPAFILDAEKVGGLYRWYNTNYASTIPLTQAVAIAKQLAHVQQLPILESQQLTIYPESPEGTITHPPVSAAYQRQWVYIIRDQQAFQQQVQTLLGINR